MKVVTRKELMELKERTLYSNVNDGCLEGLYLFEESLVMDFIHTNLLIFPQDKDSKGWQGTEDLDLVLNKKEFELDLNCSSRDGLYDDSQLYAIYEKTDLLKLINKLQEIYIENYTE